MFVCSGLRSRGIGPLQALLYALVATLAPEITALSPVRYHTLQIVHSDLKQTIATTVAKGQLQRRGLAFDCYRNGQLPDHLKRGSAREEQAPKQCSPCCSYMIILGSRVNLYLGSGSLQG